MLDLWELSGRGDCRFSTFRGARGWRSTTRASRSLFTRCRLATRRRFGSAARARCRSSKTASTLSAICGRLRSILSESSRTARHSSAGRSQKRSRTSSINGPIVSLFPRSFPISCATSSIASTAPDAAHLRNQIEGAFKKSLEQLSAERERALPAFRRKLQPARKALEQKKFFGGAEPTYADYILFGVLQWARVTSLEKVLEPDDPLTDWFERVLDLYQGVARSERSRTDRMKETAA